MGKLKKFISLGAIFFLTLVTSLSSFADDQPDPSRVSIRGWSEHGSGCPVGTVGSALSPDQKTLSLLFDHYIAEAGGSNAKPSDEKICVVNLELNVPDGWSFSLFSADYRGFAAVEAGAMAAYEATYSFPDGPNGGNSAPPAHDDGGNVAQNSFSSRIFRGPFNSNYILSNKLPLQALEWAPCDGDSKSLRIRTSLIARVLNPQNRPMPSADITLDSMDSTVSSKVEQKFGVSWKHCDGRFRPAPPFLRRVGMETPRRTLGPKQP